MIIKLLSLLMVNCFAYCLPVSNLPEAVSIVQDSMRPKVIKQDAIQQDSIEQNRAPALSVSLVQPAISSSASSEMTPQFIDVNEDVIIYGAVVDDVAGEPLIGVHVRIVKRDIVKRDTVKAETRKAETRKADQAASAKIILGAISDLDGQFEIAHVPAGDYVVEASMLGFAPFLKTVTVGLDMQRVKVPITLKEEAFLLSEIVVKPAPQVLTEADIYSAQSISASQIQLAAQYDEDIYRTVTRIPGLVANDFASRISIRGGEHDEVLVTFDGLELNDPFHLKDFGGGGMSIIDTGVIGDVMLSTGAFPAMYGDRLSGVFEIKSAEQIPDRGKSSIGLSLMNARAFSQGSFSNGDTQWMFSGRRGYLDFLLDLTNAFSSYSPQFYDMFAKVSHQIGSRHKIALEGLLSG
ncbi:MAG: carboxypeptidase-like regulatory domain-containing protein, partial [Rhodothermales bacterium]